MQQQNSDNVAIWQLPLVGEAKKKIPVSPQLSANQISAIAELKQQAFDQASQSALQQAQPQINAQLQSLQTIIDSLQQPIELINDNLQQQIINLSIALAQHVLQQTINADPQALLTIVQNVIKHANDDFTDACLYLSASDAELLQQFISNGDIKLQQLKIEADATLQSGEARFTKHDLTIDSSLRKILEQSSD